MCQCEHCLCVSALAQGKVSFSEVLELDIDDLLGRDSVTPNQNLLSKNITNKIVMITGAGGSIGAVSFVVNSTSSAKKSFVCGAK